MAGWRRFLQSSGGRTTACLKRVTDFGRRAGQRVFKLGVLTASGFTGIWTLRMNMRFCVRKHAMRI